MKRTFLTRAFVISMAAVVVALGSLARSQSRSPAHIQVRSHVAQGNAQ